MSNWFELRSDLHLGIVRNWCLPRVACGRCGVWAGAAAYPTSETALIESIHVQSFIGILRGKQQGPAAPPPIVQPSEFTTIAHTVEGRLRELEGHVSPGMSIGIAHEWTSSARPPKLAPVQFVGLYEGVMVSESARERLSLHSALSNAEWLPVLLREDRGPTRHLELRFRLAGSSPSWLWSDDERPCPECGRRRHKWRGVEAGSIPEHVSHFNVPDFPTKFVVREDLAALLAEIAGPALTLIPVQLHRQGGRSDSRRRVVAFDTVVANRFLAEARTSHELWHGAHLLSEARRDLTRSLVNPLMRRYPSWEKPGNFELDPCSPPLRRGGQPALGVEGPVVLSYEAHEYAGVAQDVRNAVMGMGSVWRDASGYAGDLAGEILSASLKARDISQWASDWLEVRFVEGAGLPDETTREVRARWLAGEGTIAETSTTGERIRLGTSVLKSRKHGAQLPRHRVREDEDLDVLQFVRRFGESTVHFPSLARVAVQPWLEAIGEADAAALAQVAQEIATLGYTTECVGWMAPYRWDAEILFRERWPSIEAMTLSRTGRAMALPTPALSALLDGRDPDPHVGVLYASVGVDVANDDALRTWALGTFALMESASGIVASATPHEIIALLPVTTIGRAVQTLRASFEGPADALSVGVGIDRFDEPVCEMLEAARGVSSRGAEVGVAARREGTWIREAHTSIEAFSPPSPTFRAPELTAVFETAHAALRRARR